MSKAFSRVNKKEKTHDDKVKAITESVNRMLKYFKIDAVLAPSGSNRNIYRRSTEVAYEIGREYVLTLSVDDPLLGLGSTKLDAVIGEEIVKHLRYLRQYATGKDNA